MLKEKVSFYDHTIAAAFVGAQEGFRGEAYLCPAGVWTIGYGHTKGVKQGDTITQENALELLKNELKDYQRDLNGLVKVPVTESMFIALISFIYNFGVAKCRGYTLFKLLNEGRYEEASEWFPKYCSPNTPYEKGLKARRLREQVMFVRDGF